VLRSSTAALAATLVASIGLVAITPAVHASAATRQRTLCVEPPREGFGGAVKDGSADDPTLEQSARQERNLADALKEREGLYTPLELPGPPNELHADVPNGSVAIPVHVHVLFDPARPETRLTEDEIASQMTELNRAFSGDAQSPDTPFRFNLADTDYTANDFQLVVDTPRFDTIKKSLNKGGLNELNLYVANPSTPEGLELLGQASFPGGVAEKDFALIGWDTIPGARGGAMEGKTADHEVGHWLNLLHTFENGCGVPGDYIADTPPEAYAASGCPTIAVPGPYNPFHNYMDYTDDPCMFQFTPNQVQRMADSWVGFRMPVPAGRSVPATHDTITVR
jgi:hypothetical protein